MKSSLIVINFILLLLISVASCKKAKDGNKPEWAKKDIRDYNDADLERLLDQWEVSYYKYFVEFYKIDPKKKNYFFYQRKMKSRSKTMNFPNIYVHLCQ